MLQSLKVVTVFSLAFIVAGCNSSDSVTDPSVNSGSLRVLKETFANADGTTDIATYEYAANGTPQKRELRRDEVLTQIDTYNFNDAGQLERLSFDSNADGQIDFYDEPEYDNQGRVTRVYEYNGAGEITAYKQFAVENDLIVKRETRTVDNITSADQLDGTIGTLQRTLVYNYEDSRLNSFTIDFDSNGVTDGNMAHSYNPDGTISTIVHSTVDQGTLWTLTMEYEAGPCTRYFNVTQDYVCIAL